MTFLYCAVRVSKILSNFSNSINFFSPSFLRLMIIALRAGESVKAFKEETKTAKEIVRANCW